VSLSEIFKQRQQTLGLSDWEVNKRFTQLKDGEQGNPNRYFNATKQAIADMDKASGEKIRLLFLAVGVDIEAAIAAATAVAQKP
jgi:hypothetical protein